MKILKIILVSFIFLTCSVKADLNQNLIKTLDQGGKLIFIRHAYAPGSGDPKNFNLNDCSTQRNLSNRGKDQSKIIGNFFSKYNINIKNVYSSEWCRCQDTAKLAFGEYKNLNYLNSFFDERYSKNKKKQIIELKKFIKNWDQNEDLIFVTHYVVILEILNLGTGSGDIVFFDKNYNVLDIINTFD